LCYRVLRVLSAVIAAREQCHSNSVTRAYDTSGDQLATGGIDTDIAAAVEERSAGVDNVSSELTDVAD